MVQKPASLTKTELAAALVFKILLGFLYGYIYLHYYNGDDTWKHHHYSLDETRLLINDPAQFFINEYTPVHALTDGKSWREVVSLYFNDLQYALLVKSMAILNLVTQGNYYINMAVFNGITLFGHYWLFTSLYQRFQEKRKWLYFSCFFYAPAVFWLSGLRIDGLLFFFAGLFIRTITREKINPMLLAVSFAGMLVCRPEIAILAIPAAIAFAVGRSRPHAYRYFLFIYAAAAALFFITGLFPGGGLPQLVADKQQQFLLLKGTRFHLTPLDASLFTYLKVLPEAWLNTFMRPLPWEATGLLQWFACMEIVLFWIFLLLAINYRRADWRERMADPLLLLLLFFGIFVYLSVGYLVPFPGAIIRYKAVALLLLVQWMTVICKKSTN